MLLQLLRVIRDLKRLELFSSFYLYATKSSHKDALSLVSLAGDRASEQGNLEVVRLLVKCGIDVNARDYGNWTPLLGASHYGHLEVVQFLLEHGADVHASDHGGWTSLQWPSYNGDPEIVRVLLEHGADANTRDNSNWTPLHGALQQGHGEVAQVLLEHGADVNSHDDIIQTPLDPASRAGHLRLIQLLVKNNEGPALLVIGRRNVMRLASLLVVSAVFLKLLPVEPAASSKSLAIVSAAFSLPVACLKLLLVLLHKFLVLVFPVSALFELLDWWLAVSFVFLAWSLGNR